MTIDEPLFIVQLQNRDTSRFLPYMDLIFIVPCSLLNTVKLKQRAENEPNAQFLKKLTAVSVSNFAFMTY